MTYIIIKGPHDLDDIWEFATEAYSKAQSAVDALKAPYTNEEIDALVDSQTNAAYAILALPARNVGDTLYKLMVSGVWDGSHLKGANTKAICDEASDLIDAAIAEGQRQQREAAHAAS